MSKEMSFLIFCLENYKVHHNMSGKMVYKLFSEHGVLDYIIEFYDVLHTTGDEYINNDIDIYLQVRGVNMQVKA